MKPTDEQIERMIMDCKLMGDALSMDSQDKRAAHVYNAMAALILARTPEIAERMDAERLDRARVVI